MPLSAAMNQMLKPDGTQESAAEISVPAPLLARRYGVINWYGLGTLYEKEVRRFVKVWMQSLFAPMVTSLLFLAVFTLALGDAGRGAPGVRFDVFLAPGLMMMAMVQNAFANTSSSMVISKVQGNIVDVLMPPITPLELTAAYVLSGTTRGVMVGLITGLGMWSFVPLPMVNPALVLYFALSASLMMSCLGLIAGIWADKFDHIAAVTNFIIMPAAFLSGTFYSIDRLPGLFNDLAHINPFFFMIDGLRAGFIGHSDAPIWLGMLVAALLNLILITICAALIQRGYKLKS
jgi:ABC-2 type transport system permease protein